MGILFLGGNDNQGCVTLCSVKSGFTLKIRALGPQLSLPVHLRQFPSAAAQVITLVYLDTGIVYETQQAGLEDPYGLSS